MNSKELNKRLKDKIIDNLYLFTGDEDYIKDVYINKIKNIVLENDISGLNFIQYDELPDLNELTDSIESVPIMCDKKIILFNSLNLFGNSVRKDIKSDIVNILEDLPEYTVVIIRESSTSSKSKTSPIYKIVDKKGCAVDCELLSAQDMLIFINKEVSKRNKKISREDLTYLISLSDGTINFVINEIDKLIAYIGDNEIIGKYDIDLLVKKPIEDKVFDLFDLIIRKEKCKAFNVLNDLKLLKNQHSPAQIFSIICDNFVNMYIAINNSKSGVTNAETVEILELPPNRAFVVSKLLKQGNGIDLTRLKKIIKRLSEMDIQIKTGIINPYYAIEEIISVF